MDNQLKDNKMDESFKVFKMRWLILFIYVLGSATGNMQWMQYGIIGDVLILYYGVSFEAVNWSSMVYLLFYVLFVFPGSYILDKYGLRVSMIIGMLGTSIGAWVKLASVAPDRYWVLLLGQIIVSISQVFFLAIPAKLAAVWFGSNEVSTACGIGIAGIQVGIAIGFVVPPVLMRSQHDISMIETDLYIMAVGVSIICAVLLIIICCFFTDKPPKPPSHASMHNQNNDVAFLQAIRKLMTNNAFLLILGGFGIDLGIFCAVSALLNQIILTYYPDGFVDAGRIGLLMVLAGIMGSLLTGAALDKFKYYRGTLVALKFLNVLMLVLFTYTIQISIIFVYVTIGLLGLFMGGLWSVCFEVTVETTYPEPEGIAVGLIYACAQGLGILLTYLYSFLFYELSDIWANNILSAISLIGFIMIAFVRFELRREAANFKKDTDNLGYTENYSSKV